jgi:hypothetical protein
MIAPARALMLLATAADALLGVVAAVIGGEGGTQVLYGFLAVLGGLIGTAALYLAVGKWAIRRLEALEAKQARDLRDIEARTDQRHADNIATQQKMWAFLLGVEGVGGILEEQRRSKRMRHEAAQDITVLFGLAGEHSTQIARLSDRAGVPFDPPSLERPRRRADDG